jgi:2-oxo-4-hydroxy-4-carboxy-5-ureidoimidazoline decarboxylase
MTLSIDALSAMDRDAFTKALDGIWEHSPWVAERSWEKRPFADVASLHHAMAGVVTAASEAKQLALIKAHPELAGRAAIRGELTAESRQEQGGVGLDRCSPEEFARLTDLNAKYNAKFGHPFIIAVRGHTRASIIEAFSSRLDNAPQAERAESLAQIAKIALLRLNDRIPAASSAGHRDQPQA